MTQVSNTSFDNAMTHLTKIAEMTKNQQQVEGKIVMDLVNAASAPAQPQVSKPVGNIGHNINTTA